MEKIKDVHVLGIWNEASPLYYVLLNLVGTDEYMVEVHDFNANTGHPISDGWAMYRTTRLPNKFTALTLAVVASTLPRTPGSGPQDPFVRVTELGDSGLIGVTKKVLGWDDRWEMQLWERNDADNLYQFLTGWGLAAPYSFEELTEYHLRPREDAGDWEQATTIEERLNLNKKVYERVVDFSKAA